MTKVVINRCFGGFGLSERAYERLIELGVPRVPYIAQVRDSVTGLYRAEPRNEGKVILDFAHPEATLEPGFNRENHIRLCGRYSAAWIEQDRSSPLLVQVVADLGDAANGRFAKLSVVEIPDGIEWEIDENDGRERVVEKHRSWS